MKSMVKYSHTFKADKVKEYIMHIATFDLIEWI